MHHDFPGPYNAELVGCPGLALADALHLRRVQGVQLVLVLGALGQDAAGALQQVLDLDFGRFGQHVQLALHFAVYPANTGAQRAHGLVHALELLGMRIAPNLRGQARGYSVVVLAQLQPVVLGRLHQMLAALIQQTAVSGMGDCFGHDGGVYDHLLHAGAANCTAAVGGVNAGGQQCLHAFFANALSPAAQA